MDCSNLWRGALLVGLLLLAGCVSGFPRAPGPQDTAPSSGVYWTPPESVPPPATRPAPSRIPEEFLARKWGIADVVDLALRNNPATRSAWETARAAAASYGSVRSAYYPQVNLQGSGSVSETRSSWHETVLDQITHGPQASLSWLLLDFGGRSASLESARQVLMAADWTHNAAIQTTILTVEQAYYSYLAAEANLKALHVSQKEAEANLDVANGRHKAGVATIADVLLARTALSQVVLAVQTAQGQIQTTRGALAVSMGLPANVPFDVEAATLEVPPEGISRQVDALIDQSLAHRPDLAAAQAQLRALEADVLQVRSRGLPTLSLSGNLGRTYFIEGGSGAAAPDHHEDTYGAGLLVQFPLFTGYAQTYNVRRAEALARASRADAESLEQQVVFQVFRDYYALQTATQQVRTTDDLLASATQSQEVSLGRYKAGVGTLVDLLTAQAALASARAQGIQARYGWYSTLAQLASDTGLIGIEGTTPLYSPPGAPGKP